MSCAERVKDTDGKYVQFYEYCHGERISAARCFMALLVCLGHGNESIRSEQIIVMISATCTLFSICFHDSLPPHKQCSDYKSAATIRHVHKRRSVAIECQQQPVVLQTVNTSVRMWLHGGAAVLVLCGALLSVGQNSQLGQHLEENSADEAYECYARYMRTPFNLGVLVVHKNHTDVARYVASVHSLHTLINMKIAGLTDAVKRITVQRYGLVVLLVAAPDDLDDCMGLLSILSTHYQQTKLLVAGVAREFAAATHGIFLRTKEHNLLNVAELAWNDTRVYTHFPYEGGACAEWSQAEVLGACQGLAFDALFPAKLPKQFNGCAMEIPVDYPPPGVIDSKSASEQPLVAGYRLALSNLILRRLNLTRNRTSNLRVSSYCCSQYSYYVDTVSLYVPAAGPRAQWKNVVRVFQTPLWVAVLAFFLLNALAWWLVGTGAASYVQCLLGSLRSLLNGSVPLPRRTPLRFLVVSWTLCTLVLSAAYQSQLLSTLLTPVADDQSITNEQQLYATDMSVDIEMTGPVLTYVRNRMQIYKQRRKHASDPSRPRAVLRFALSAKYLARGTRGRPALYQFKEPNSLVPLCVNLDWRIPVLQSVNRLMRRLMENGIVAKFMRDVDFSHAEVDELADEPLSLGHLNFAFFALLLGHALATLAFLLETMVWRKQHGCWRTFCTMVKRWWRVLCSWLSKWRRTIRTKVREWRRIYCERV